MITALAAVRPQMLFCAVSVLKGCNREPPLLHGTEGSGMETGGFKTCLGPWYPAHLRESAQEGASHPVLSDRPRWAWAHGAPSSGAHSGEDTPGHTQPWRQHVSLVGEKRNEFFGLLPCIAQAHTRVHRWQMCM